MGGGSGAISQVPNPEGQGIGGGGPSQPQGAGGPEPESVYVPPAPESGAAPDNASSGVPGQAAPQQPGGIEGRGADGGDGAQTPADLGAGARTQIRTPYTEVIGKYAEQATQALDRVYIPADARDYVKNYFIQLGK
jgi:hypothetical protein